MLDDHDSVLQNPELSVLYTPFELCQSSADADASVVAKFKPHIVIMVLPVKGRFL